MYITIEGPIGVGKSSLTKILSKELNYQTLYEIVEENPFLSRFYEDQEQYAFQTEMFFLTNRYTQLKNVRYNIENNNTKYVADYDIHKNMIFARKTLNQEDLNTFSDIFNTMCSNLLDSTVTIFLTASLDTLKKRILMRARSFEIDIDDEYLLYLIDAYNTYVEEQIQNRPNQTLVFDCDNLDFVYNDCDRKNIINTINTCIIKNT